MRVIALWLAVYSCSAVASPERNFARSCQVILTREHLENFAGEFGDTLGDLIAAYPEVEVALEWREKKQSANRDLLPRRFESGKFSLPSLPDKFGPDIAVTLEFRRKAESERLIRADIFSPHFHRRQSYLATSLVAPYDRYWDERDVAIAYSVLLSAFPDIEYFLPAVWIMKKPFTAEDVQLEPELTRLMAEDNAKAKVLFDHILKLHGEGMEDTEIWQELVSEHEFRPVPLRIGPWVAKIVRISTGAAKDWTQPAKSFAHGDHIEFIYRFERESGRNTD